MVDPDNSVFFDYFMSGDRKLRISRGSRIEGIDRPRVEASFIASVIDRMIRVPDAASIAAVHWLERILGRKCGGSTGTNLYGALRIAEEMIEKRETGSIVALQGGGCTTVGVAGLVLGGGFGSFSKTYGIAATRAWQAPCGCHRCGAQDGDEPGRCVGVCEKRRCLCRIDDQAARFGRDRLERSHLEVR